MIVARELHKDEVHKLTAIIRKYDAEIRQLKTQGGGSEATLALARSATDEATAKVAALEKELAAQSVGLGKAEAAAEIAAARRAEAEGERERAVELLEKKAADVKEARAKAADLEAKLASAEGGAEMTRLTTSLANLETQYAAQKRMNGEKASIISELERDAERLRDGLASAEAKHTE